MLEVLLLRQTVNVGYFSKLPAAPTATPHLHPLFAPPCGDCQVKRVRPAGTMAVVITQFTTPKSCLPACMSTPPPTSSHLPPGMLEMVARLDKVPFARRGSGEACWPLALL